MKLKIFGHTYKVVKQKKMVDNGGVRGLCIPEKQLILIDADLVGQEYIQTLVHEVVHAILSRTGIEQAKLSEGVEEIICENIATAITENFKLTYKK